MKIMSLLSTSLATVLTAHAAFTGTNQIEPDSGGNEAAVIMVLVIGAIIVAALNGKPKVDPSKTDEK